ncbi:MAG: flagellin FliC [Magnetococcales bacterium]|nr:flagellin FliC [Magnetococcales bacterium]
MAFVINTSVNVVDIPNTLRETTRGLSDTFQRLASGMRANLAVDGTAGLSLAARMTAQISQLSTSICNANDGIAMVQIMAGALEEGVYCLRQMRQRAVRATQASLTTEERLALQQEVDHLLGEMHRIAQDMQFDGCSFLAGQLVPAATTDRIVIQVGTRAGQAISFDIPDIRPDALWGDGHLSPDGYQANIATPVAAEETIQSVDLLLHRVMEQRSELRRTQNRFTAVIANLNNVVENLSAARSCLTDADLAAQMAVSTQKIILQKAGAAILAQANQQPQWAMHLLH